MDFLFILLPPLYPIPTNTLKKQPSLLRLKKQTEQHRTKPYEQQPSMPTITPHCCCNTCVQLYTCTHLGQALSFSSHMLLLANRWKTKRKFFMQLFRNMLPGRIVSVPTTVSLLLRDQTFRVSQETIFLVILFYFM